MDGEEGREEPAGLTADSVPRVHQFTVAVSENDKRAFVGEGIVAAALLPLPSSSPCCHRLAPIAVVASTSLTLAHTPPRLRRCHFYGCAGLALAPVRCW